MNILILIVISLAAGPSPSAKNPENDPLYAKSIKDIEILAILEYDDMKIAVFRDRKTNIIHPLQTGNYLTHGRISMIDASGVRVTRKGKPDYRYSIFQRIVKDPGKEYVSFSLQNADIRGILANLALPSDKQVMVDGKLDRKLSMNVKVLHWRDVLNILALTFDLQVEETDDEIKILKFDTAERLSK